MYLKSTPITNFRLTQQSSKQVLVASFFLSELLFVVFLVVLGIPLCNISAYAVLVIAHGLSTIFKEIVARSKKGAPTQVFMRRGLQSETAMIYPLPRGQ